MRIIFTLFFLLFTLEAIELDVAQLERAIATKPSDVDSRIVLARNYIAQGDDDKAQKQIDEVLAYDKNESKALFLKKEITKLQKIAQLTKSQPLEVYFAKLHAGGNDAYVTLMYETLKRNNRPVGKAAAAVAAQSYLALGLTAPAEKMITSAELDLDEKQYIKAKIAHIGGDFEGAQKWYEAALEQKTRDDAIIGLYDVYGQLGKIDDRKALLSHFPDHVALKQKEQATQRAFLQSVKAKYEKEKNFENLQPYYHALEAVEGKKASLSQLQAYINAYPHDEKAALFAANSYLWDHQPKMSLHILKPIVDQTGNKEIIRLYADLLLGEKRVDEAAVYLAKLSQMQDPKATDQLSKIQNDDLLLKAVEAHKNKNYASALRDYEAYYAKTKDPKIAKEIAELYFVQNAPEKSLPFYVHYLEVFPSDYKIRFRYASALDATKAYESSEGEYKKIASLNDPLSSLATYRYANAMILQNNEVKWNASRSILKNLQTKLTAEPSSKERDALLGFTKATLAKVQKPMPKPTRFKDIMLAEGQVKDIKQNEVFNYSKVSKEKIASVKSMILPKDQKRQRDREMRAEAHFLDDDTIHNFSYGIRAGNVLRILEGDLSIGAKKSRFKTSTSKHDVKTLTVAYKKEAVGVEIGAHAFQTHNAMQAKLTYDKKFIGHDVQFGAAYLNGAFVNAKACMIDQKIDAFQLSIYDAILLSNLDQAEISLTANRYDDTNLNLNSWIEYPIYKKLYKGFENNIVFSGSYEYNTKIDTCYFPSRFFDGNSLLWKPKIFFKKGAYLQGIGGAGYSFKNQDWIYNYGFSGVISMYKLFDVRIDCKHYQSGYSPNGANECGLSAAYLW